LEIIQYNVHLFYSLLGKSRLFLSALTLFICFLSMSAHTESCARKKASGRVQKAAAGRSAAYILKKIQTGLPAGVQSLNAKADLYVAGQGGSINASASIIWLRDSVVWINVRKFGLEAARALITRDSVFTLNRLEKTYTANDLRVLQQQYHLPEGFDLIQLFVAGRPWFFPDIALEADIQDSLHWLHGQNAGYTADYHVEEGTWQVRKQHFGQRGAERAVMMDFSDFQEAPLLAIFPVARRLTATSPETGKVEVDIRLRDMEWNKATGYRFEIPAHYRRVEN
jgi:hypothetical protein